MRKTTFGAYVVLMIVVGVAAFLYGRHISRATQDIIYRDGMKYGCTALARSAADATFCTSMTYSIPQSYPGVSGFSH